MHRRGWVASQVGATEDKEDRKGTCLLGPDQLKGWAGHFDKGRPLWDQVEWDI